MVIQNAAAAEPAANLNVVRKIRSASQSYGRGSDNYRQPALYGIFNAEGKKVGIILGKTQRFMESGEWEVCRLDAAGFPRTVQYFTKFSVAKAFAEQWDASAAR